jgi:hypothetical protein
MDILYLYRHSAETDFEIRYSLRSVRQYLQTEPRAGFYAPANYETITARCQGKKFLNFDDAGFNDDMRRYLQKRFPSPCDFERHDRPDSDKATIGVLEPLTITV